MRLWIDDIRPAPPGWVWAKTSGQALLHLSESAIEEISFDHDLGGDDTTMPVARMIEDGAHRGTISRLKWSIHSANPVGRANLKASLESAERLWDARERGLERERYGS